jgi:very-short-patch-repair endonuclease
LYLDMGEQSATPDLDIARIAARQYGVVSFRQLTLAGIGRNAVARRVRRGGLHRVHRGVYAVGHRALSAEGRWMAAVLACGTGVVGSGTVYGAWGAAVSHRSAAQLWELLAYERGPPDVIFAGKGGRRPRAGIRLHRSRNLVDAEVTLRRGIPVTIPARTLADLARVAPGRVVRRARRQAELTRLLGGAGDGSGDFATLGTRSDLERDFLALCRHHHLPTPEVNVKLATDLTVDFLWRSRCLVVETDSHTYHRGVVAFEDDHRRDFELRRLGYTVHRYTGAQLRGYPAEIAAELGENLS